MVIEDTLSVRCYSGNADNSFSSPIRSMAMTALGQYLAFKAASAFLSAEGTALQHQ